MPKALAKEPDQTDTQITHPKKLRFLEYYRETRGHISDCARAVEIERKTYYNWLDTDPVFAMAIAEAEAELNDEMRDALIKKGADGDLGAIIFYLKNRHPDFKQKYEGASLTKVDVFQIGDAQFTRITGGTED